jgi:hypothetical protein
MPKSKFAHITRENRARRVALRRGMRVSKSGLKDPQALGYGGFMLTDLKTGKVRLGNDGHPFSATVDDVERFLGVVS